MQQLQDTLAHTEIKDEIEKLENRSKKNGIRRGMRYKNSRRISRIPILLNQNRKESEIKIRKIRVTQESLQNEVSKYENRVDYLKLKAKIIKMV